MIIRKNTPCMRGRGVPSPARKHANVFRSLGGVAVLFTVRKHACAPEGKSGRGPKKAYPVILQGVFLRIIVIIFVRSFSVKLV